MDRIREKIADGYFLNKWITKPMNVIQTEIARRSKLIKKHTIISDSVRSSLEMKNKALNQISCNKHIIDVLNELLDAKQDE